MTWRVRIERQGTATDCEVRTGQIQALDDADGRTVAMAAADPAEPGVLGLVLGGDEAVTLAGRAVPGPLLAIGRGGGSVRADGAGGPLVLAVAAAEDEPQDRPAVCQLCRGRIGQGQPARRCTRCRAGFHAACAGRGDICPSCGARLPRRPAGGSRP